MAAHGFPVARREGQQAHQKENEHRDYEQGGDVQGHVLGACERIKDKALMPIVGKCANCQ